MREAEMVDSRLQGEGHRGPGNFKAFPEENYSGLEGDFPSWTNTSFLSHQGATGRVNTQSNKGKLER